MKLKAIYKELEVFNRISFEESTHKYFIDGQPTQSPSVTQFLSRYKRPFNSDEAAKKLGKRIGVDPAEILKDWSQSNLFSRVLGSNVHRYIEHTYDNTVSFDQPIQDVHKLTKTQKADLKKLLPVLVKQFHQFQQDHKHLSFVASELAVGDLDGSRVCGTLDALMYNKKTKELEILDFKTNKKIELSSPYGTLSEPFTFLPDCEHSTYTLQLNVYKHFIEKYTSLKIGAMHIVWFNVKNKTYVPFKIKESKVQNILQQELFKMSVGLTT